MFYDLHAQRETMKDRVNSVVITRIEQVLPSYDVTALANLLAEFARPRNGGILTEFWFLNMICNVRT